MASQNHDWFTRNREDPLAPPNPASPNSEPQNSGSQNSGSQDPGPQNSEHQNPEPQNSAPRGSSPEAAESDAPASEAPTGPNPSDATATGPAPDDIWAPGNEAWLATHVTSRASDLPDQPPVLGGSGARPGDFTRVQPGAPSAPQWDNHDFDPGNLPQPNPTWSEQEGGHLAPNGYAGGPVTGGPPGHDPSGRPPEMPAPPTVHRARDSQPLSHPSAAYPPASTPSAAYPPASNTSVNPPAPPQRQAPLAPPPGYHDQPMPPQSLSVQELGPVDGPPPAGPPVQPPPDQAPLATPQPERPDRNRGRLALIITAAVLALALVAFLALRYGGKAAEPPPPPSGTVRTYLEAIARGDAETARAQLTEVPADDVLLNQQALATSQEAAPLQVTSTTDGTGGQVTATYTLGGEPMTTLFNTAHQPDGSYRVDGLVSVDLPAFGKLPLLVNGIDMAGRAKVRAFPGRYVLTTGLPFISYDKPELTVSGPDRGAQTEATPVITPEGVKALRAAARSKLDECLRSHDLAPAGCVLEATTNGAPVVPGSVNWKVSNPPFIKAEPRLGYGNPSRVEFDTEFVSRVELRFESSTDKVSGSDQTFEVRVTADLGGTKAPRDVKFNRR